MTRRHGVLLVETERAGHSSLGDLLSRTAGRAYRIQRIPKGADTLEAVLSARPDVILIDDDQAGEAGLAVARRLAAAAVATPKILIAARGDAAAEAEAFAGGVVDFIIRDQLSPALLQRAIRHAVEREGATLRLRELKKQLNWHSLELEKIRKRSEAQNANYMKLAEHLAQAELKEQTAFIIAEERKQRYETLAQHSNVGIWQLAPDDGTSDYLNPAMCALLQVESIDEVRGEPFFNLFQADALKLCLGQLQKWRDGGFSSFESEIVGRRNGKGSHVVISGSPLYGLEGELSQILLTVIDITERKNAVETMRNMARKDALTGLFNRFVFQDRLLQAIANAERIGRSVAILYIDLDDFKGVNDTLGHKAGDELLQHVAGQIRAATRSSDTAARLGGDEFAVILTNLQTPQAALYVVRQILDRFEQPFSFEGQPIRARASIGVTLFPQDGQDPDRLLRNADAALYRAKGGSRGRYQFYDAAFAAPMEQARALEVELQAAIEKDELVLYYQPQIELSSNRVPGLEALLRWNSPTRGLIYPDSIIPIAEKTGLIAPIGAWVVREACRQAADWDRRGCPAQRIAVNLSARQLQCDDFVALVADALREHDLAPERLELEITESMVLEDIDQAIAVLNALRELGVGVAMDDFGTGYSSLTYLKLFPIDQLKIDRSFVSRIPDEADNRAIVTATTVLGHSLNVRVVAEGVETEEQSRFLREAGCDEVQGYYYCRPLPAGQIHGWLEAWDAGARLAPREVSDA